MGDNDTMPDDDMLPAERENWLRERGVLIETASDRRKASNLSSSNKDPGEGGQRPTSIVEQVLRLSIDNVDNNDNDGGVDGIIKDIKFVYIPHDDTKPISTLVLPRRLVGALGPAATGDMIPTYVKSYFADGKSLDVQLFEEHAKNQNLVGSGQLPESFGSTSATALADVTMGGNVETFPLVRPSSTNRHEGVYIYLDEVGLLKKLPNNKRASQLAYRCGYHPAPNFYGDIFVGRAKSSVTHQLCNVDITAEDVIDTTKEWMVRAPQENVAWQQMVNKVTGREGQIQPDHAGTEGKAVQVEATDDENGGTCSYSWMQNEEEIEITISRRDPVYFAKDVDKKSIKVVFQSQQIMVKCNGALIFDHKLYSRLDVDGCTWTMDKNSLIITLQKASEGETWPRLVEF